MGNFKNGNGVSLLQWSPNSFNFSRHTESVIFIAAKFVLPDQWLQSLKVRCNFSLCNSKFYQILDHAGKNRGHDEEAEALTVSLPAYIYKHDEITDVFAVVVLHCIHLYV